MNFDEAKHYRLPFGRFSGKTLDEAAQTNSGLRWLDWILGEGIKSPQLKEAIKTYLDDPSIRRELEDLDEEDVGDSCLGLEWWKE